MVAFENQFIQNACKVCKYGFWTLLVLNCGTPSPLVETVRFRDSTVSISNGECPVTFTMFNSSSNTYTVASLIGTFEDVDGKSEEITVPQDELLTDVQPPFVAGQGTSEANVSFDLTGLGLKPPLHGTVIVVGVAGSQVTHFVGNFECE